MLQLVVPVQSAAHRFTEVFVMCRLQPGGGGVPTFVVDAADRRRQLRPEMGHQLDRQTVARRVQGRAQRSVGRVLVVEPELPSDFVEPFVRFWIELSNTAALVMNPPGLV
jgi:hypothetical protein